MDPTLPLQKKLSFVQVFQLVSLQKSFPWGTKKGEKPTAEPHNILKKSQLCTFFASQKLTQSTLLKMFGSCNFFVNQSGARKDGVLGVHFRPKEFK